MAPEDVFAANLGRCWDQQPPEMAPGIRLGAFQRPPWRILGGFQDGLDATGRILGGLGGTQGAFGTVQEPCLTPGAAYRKTRPWKSGPEDPVTRGCP